MTGHKDFVSTCRRRKWSPPIVKTSGISEVAAFAAHTDLPLRDRELMPTRSNASWRLKKDHHDGSFELV